MQRHLALLTGAVSGALAAVLFSRLRGKPGAPARPTPPGDPRDDLRRKLAEARETAPDERDFQAAGMGPETIVVEEEPKPHDEFEAMRRRVHEEGRAAAEEMRRRADDEGEGRGGG